MTNSIDTSIFKSYDIRGVYPAQADEKLADQIARCFAKYLNFPEKMIVARDGRTSGESMKQAVINGLTKVGVNIIDIDMASSDCFYYACQTRDLPGITVTASHNPKEYTGFKMVKKIPEFLSGDAGIKEIKDWIVAGEVPTDSATLGTIETQNVWQEYVDYVASLIDTTKVKPLNVFADTANGMVGPFLELLSQKIPQVKLNKMYWDIDGTFPNHGGDPLLPENRVEIQKQVPQNNGDLGVMFDPDGDRFFVIDKKGRFVPGDFLTALFSEYFIKRYPGCGIVYDIRASKAVREVIAANGGKAFPNRIGHTHIKARMKQEGAYFGGEVSGHYYFKDFFLCDSGLVAFVYLLEYLSITPKTLDQIVDEYSNKYFLSGEINNKVADSQKIMTDLENIYGPKAVSPVEKMDGLTFEMGDWRFNVRSSNTEPLLRLNLEADNQELMEQKRDEVLGIITK